MTTNRSLGGENPTFSEQVRLENQKRWNDQISAAEELIDTLLRQPRELSRFEQISLRALADEIDIKHSSPHDDTVEAQAEQELANKIRQILGA